MFQLTRRASLVRLRAIASRGLTAVAACWPAVCVAHLLPGDKDVPFNPWAWDPVAGVLLAIAAVLYWRGSRKLEQRHGEHRRRRRRRLQFWGGWLTLVIALVSPVDSFGEVLFSVHMIQHELLMLIAAPLLVLSRPGSALILGARPFMVAMVRFATGGSRTGARFWHGLLSPLSAWFIHLIGLWGWHLPVFFNASLRNDWIHSLQHVSFVAIALIFWHAILRPARTHSYTAVVYLFTTALHASLLGALLTFSPRLWYAPYANTTQAWGLTPIADQQLGGLIMWMPAGIVFVAAALGILARILRHDEPRQSQSPQPQSGAKPTGETAREYKPND